MSLRSSAAAGPPAPSSCSSRACAGRPQDDGGRERERVSSRDVLIAGEGDCTLAPAAAARGLGVTGVEEMAEGIVRIAVAQMANAIREISIERGYDPSDFVLLAFGGAGPMHATQIADEIAMHEILIPILPGNLSALGLLASDQSYERVRTFVARLSTLDPEPLAAALDEHECLGRDQLSQRGFEPRCGSCPKRNCTLVHGVRTRGRLKKSRCT